MSKPLPGQQGLPDVAPDVPFEGSWEEAFYDPEPERTIFAVVVDGVRASEVEGKLMEMAQDLGCTLYVVQTQPT